MKSLTAFIYPSTTLFTEMSLCSQDAAIIIFTLICYNYNSILLLFLWSLQAPACIDRGKKTQTVLKSS